MARKDWLFEKQARKVLHDNHAAIYAIGKFGSMALDVERVCAIIRRAMVRAYTRGLEDGKK